MERAPMQPKFTMFRGPKALYEQLSFGMFWTIFSAIISHLGPLPPIMCHLAAHLWHVLPHLGRQHRSSWAQETPEMADPTRYVPCRLISGLMCVIFSFKQPPCAGRRTFLVRFFSVVFFWLEVSFACAGGFSESLLGASLNFR